MNNNGWIKLFRPLADDELYFEEPFTKWQAWCDLLFMAAFKDTTVTIRGINVPVQRGQVVISERQLAERWMWSRNKIRRFFKALEKIQRIVPQKSNVTTLISIVNYNKYQSCDTTNDTTEGTTNDTTIIEEVKEGQEKKKGNSKRVSKKEFSIPTREQIEEYVGQIGSHINVTDFINYYEATEWKVKDKPMQNWKLVVQTWTRIDRERRPHLYQEQQETKEKQTESKWQG